MNIKSIFKKISSNRSVIDKDKLFYNQLTREGLDSIATQLKQ